MKNKQFISFRGAPSILKNGKWIKVKMTTSQLAKWNKKMDKEDAERRKKEEILFKDIRIAFDRFRKGSMDNVRDMQFLINYHGRGVWFQRFPSTDLY